MKLKRMAARRTNSITRVDRTPHSHWWTGPADAENPLRCVFEKQSFLDKKFDEKGALRVEH